ncbi:hypothetical protein CHLRE_04g217930v5 [Chlamydomonas reinhardtii]|uniref:Senescence domain-containing protein n=1 Tax=Chlamydomonas reinhardtii TaxID=3055 RepID=A0A2K3DTG9_CHLRE|nr:uncharacterized protein CHLRE_04g217930v5 [Chlamydomonas reinhardtii]PNW83826.1 hypothetical protein CHLRE_04g217930v5 [Chlamydomonas reinhardtii]
MTGQGEPLISIPKCALYNVSPRDDDVVVAGVGDLSVGYPAAAAGSGTNPGLEARVGEVSWPLSPQVAALRYDDHTYSFTISQAQQQSGHYYCLSLPPDAAAQLVDLLQAVLASSCAYHDAVNLQQQQVQQQQQQQQHVPSEAAAALGVPAREATGPATTAPTTDATAGTDTRADQLAAGLQRGGQLAAAGMLAAAAALGGAMHRGADAAVARWAPAEQRKDLSPEAQARLDKAKSVAAQVAEVSGKAVGGVLSVTAAAAGALAQKISGTGVGRSLSNGRVAGASVQDMRKVGVAGVEAVEAVYEGLADAARVLLAHGHSATTRVVDHKYGPGAAQATGAGFCVAQSAAETGLHVMKLRPTALVKKVIKGAAKQVVLGSAASASAAASGPGATANGPNGAGGAGGAGGRGNGHGGGGGGDLATGPIASSQSAPAVLMAPLHPLPSSAQTYPHPQPHPQQQQQQQQQQQRQQVSTPVAAASTLAALSGGPQQYPPQQPYPQQQQQPQPHGQPQHPSQQPQQQSFTQPPPQQRPPQSAAGGVAAGGVAAGGVAAGGVATGVAVTGPVPAYPVAGPATRPQPQPQLQPQSQPLPVVDYTPSAAAFYAAAAPAAAPGEAGPAAAWGAAAGLPYPAVSAGQYGAGYYPAVPRT